LKKYLLNGGVLMADDFWGELQWQGFAEQIKKVFPDRNFVDLDMTNELFHCVFDLKGPLNKLQTPSIHHIMRTRSTEYTWEYHDGEECKEMHCPRHLRRQGPHHGDRDPQLRQRR